MGTTGCVELVVEKLLGPYLGAEWLRRRVAQGEGRWPGLGFVSGGEG